MTDLATQQRAFAAAMTAQDANTLDASVFAGDAARARERLALYRGNVRANARKALAGAYPVCAALVGDAFFDALAFRYAEGTPSRSGDLNEYGAGFADLLASLDPVRDQVPYLPDVARLEWRVHRAHYAADALPSDVAALAALSDDGLANLHFAATPATALVQSRWPAARIWRAHREDTDLSQVDASPAEERALVFRPRFRVEVEILTPAEHAFLAAAVEGAAFGDALDRAIAVERAFDPGPPLARWFTGRALAAVI